MGERTEKLVNEHGFNEENLPDEDSECFDMIYEKFADNVDAEEPEVDDDTSTEEDKEPVAAANEIDLDTFKEDIKSEIREEVRQEVQAANEQEEREELVEEITSNSESYDREDLTDTPVSVLETIKESVTSANRQTVDYSAIPGASANSDTDSDSFPALSVNEILAEEEAE